MMWKIELMLIQGMELSREGKKATKFDLLKKI